MDQKKTTVHVELSHQEIDAILHALNEVQSKASGRGSMYAPAEIRTIRDKLNAAIRAPA
jgi:hypothetical protein